MLFVILNSNLSLTNWCAEISAMYQFVVAPHASRDSFSTGDEKKDQMKLSIDLILQMQ